MNRQAKLYVVALHLLVLTLGIEVWRLHTQPSRLEFMRTAHARMDASIPAGACIFLGDSITQGLAVAAVCDRAINLGIGGQTTAQLAESMLGYHSLERASRIYIMIGANDRGAGDFGLVASRLPPAVPVIWSGPTSLDGRMADQASHAENACRSLSSCTYIDTQAILAPLGSSAYLDGVHLSPSGYARWIMALRRQ